MRHITKKLAFLSVAFAAVLFGNTAFADSAIDDLVRNFNSMNGNTGTYTDGYAFTFYNYSGINSGAEGLTQKEGKLENAGTALPGMFDAYNDDPVAMTTNGSWFASICIEPAEIIYAGKLNYGSLNVQADYTTKTLDSGNVVTLGAAYLYKLYATGELTSVSQFADFYTVDRDVNVGVLREAIQALMGVTGSTATTSNNVYLAYLNGLNDIDSFWGQTYYLNRHYAGIMDDYVVFAMNVINGEWFTAGGQPILPGDVAQDLFYIAKLEPSVPDTPEPATVLLWTLGGIGLGVASRVRNRRTKKRTGIEA